MQHPTHTLIATATVVGLLGVAACSGASRTRSLDRTARAVHHAATTASDTTTPPDFSAEARTEFTTGPAAPDTVQGIARLLVPTSRAPERNMRIRVRLAGLSPGMHGWDIAHGTCVDRAAPIVVPFTATHGMKGVAAPLDADSTGTALGSAMIPRAMLSLSMVRQGRYSLRVLAQNGPEAGGIQACATL